MAKTLFCDLDGVLVDFVGGALKLHGIENYTVDTWNFDKLLFPDNTNKFWEPLGFDFWADLEWTDEGKELFDRLLKMAGGENICFLTSPCLTVGSVEGKIEWLRRNIPQLSRQYAICPAKHFLARKDALLVDDSDMNVERFVDAGGRAVTVPRLWNWTKEAAFDPAKLIHEIRTEWEILQ